MSKVVVVSGASSGIGFATATYLHDKGFNVIGISRREPKEKFSFAHYPCDIVDYESVKKLANEISKSISEVDVLINCAGMGVSGAVEYSTLEEVKQIFDVNVIGQFILTKELMPLIRKSKTPKIINIGSVAGEIIIPFQTFYSMTKAAISAFSEGLRIELKPFNIQVTTVLPGDIKTDFTKNRQMPKVISDDIYKDRIKTSIERMALDEENGMPAIVIAKAVYNLINRKRMPVAKTIGVKYKLFVFLKRILPKSFVSYIISKMYG